LVYESAAKKKITTLITKVFHHFLKALALLELYSYWAIGPESMAFLTY